MTAVRRSLLYCCVALGVWLGGCLEETGGGAGGEAGGAGGEVGGAGGEAGGAVGGGGPAEASGCLRTFVYRGIGATPAEVKLGGSFEGWQGGVALSDPDGDGFWSVDVRLPEGRYAYKFVVDGVWGPDPDNLNREDDGQGGFNSVAEHRCPFTPRCLADSDCAADVPLCRGYECRADELPACACEAPEVCNPDGACEIPAPPECDAETPCDAPLVCRAGGCEPECQQDADCEGEAICRALSCFVPQCADDEGCDLLAEACVEEVCVARPCGDRVFRYDPGGEPFDAVYLAGSFNDWAPDAEPLRWLPERGLWYARRHLENGHHTYKFVLVRGGEQRWVADPDNPDREDDTFGGQNSVLDVACEGGPPAPGRCGDLESFDWREAVMYFVMTDRFYDSDGRAVPVPGATDGDAARGPSGQYEGGDLAGVAQRVPYLRDLGVTAIWLSAPYDNRDIAGAPISPEDPNQYSGYHGYWPKPADVDYSDPGGPTPRPRVEDRIGSEEDLHAVVDAAHGAGLRVLFDYVMNHVDDQSGLYAAHRDDGWFASDNGQRVLCGENQARCGGGPCWDDDWWGKRCAFTDYLPAFDFDNPAARQWSIDDALWWAKEFELDGFRLDAIKHVPFAWLTDLRARLSAEIEAPAGGRFYLVGETFAYDDRELIKAYVDPTTMLDGQFDFPFKARACEALFTPGGSLEGFARWMDDNDRFYGAGSIMTTWIGNHDIPRAIHFASRQIGNCREGSYYGNGWSDQFPQPQDDAAYERLGLAFAVMLTNPGIPLIYYGDEIGLAGGGDPDNRRMLPWDDAALLPAQAALRSHVAALGAIRASHKVLARGRRITLSATQDTWVYRMTGCGAGDVTVAINRADDPRAVVLPAGDYVDLMTDAALTGGERRLPARSFLVLGAP